MDINEVISGRRSVRESRKFATRVAMKPDGHLQSSVRCSQHRRPSERSGSAGFPQAADHPLDQLTENQSWRTLHHRTGGPYEVNIRLALPDGREVDVGPTTTADERHADLDFAVTMPSNAPAGGCGTRCGGCRVVAVELADLLRSLWLSVGART